VLGFWDQFQTDHSDSASELSCHRKCHLFCIRTRVRYDPCGRSSLSPDSCFISFSGRFGRISIKGENWTKVCPHYRECAATSHVDLPPTLTAAAVQQSASASFTVSLGCAFHKHEDASPTSLGCWPTRHTFPLLTASLSRVGLHFAADGLGAFQRAQDHPDGPCGPADCGGGDHSTSLRLPPARREGDAFGGSASGCGEAGETVVVGL
jgi:hypothetical protein